MLSDVLSAALSEIARYRTDPTFAPHYADAAISVELDALTEHMTRILHELDTVPDVPASTPRD
jgi:hypothetical protein